MAVLPKKIGKGWDNLLLRLRLTKVDIDHINHNHRDLEDKIKDGLDRWNIENKNESYFTRTKQLLKALRDEDMTTLAEELEDEYCITEQELEYSGFKPHVIQNSPEFSDDIINTKNFSKPSDVTINTENSPEPSGDIINTGNKTGDSSAQMFLTESGPGINEDFSLRGYQTEIAQDGLRGENSIIWAGTGSGKTRVAVYIMKNHLDHKLKGRIAFFTTTVTLLEQQHRVICELLPKYKHQIRMFSGKNQLIGERLSAMVQRCRVCVLTPGILWNCLNSGSVSLNVFSMLVFDECHHTRKNELYNQIMAHYRKLHQDDSAAKQPQIIGMTASVGTERAWNVQGAEESILELMARMHVYKIATPRENMKEYKEYVPDPIRHSEVMKERKTDPVKDTIERAMKQLEHWLHTEVGVLDKDVHHLLLEMPCEHRMEQQYQSWLSRLLDALLNSKELKSDGIHQAIVVAKHMTVSNIFASEKCFFVY
ncbi:interferon-induced helicase C domain-containing protein 1-like isoform X2 [Mizuhopecten yessoensis]|nr:interferon-induced helicase C domain-containing protein 1-like isoform X2 [Mizuhopecten yessoensis]